jgi:Fur family transcriptional regulator, ferric uptake regulator
VKNGSKTSDVDQIAGARLRRLGQRLTPRRQSLLSVLGSAGHPLTIHEILDRGTGLAMSSAYRNLTVLEQAGVVHRIITREDFARYELAEELTEHHHHLVCSSCGLVRDLSSDLTVERLMRAASERAAEQGFTPVAHRLDIIGLCEDCSQAAVGGSV